jgi:hypothetical protein
MQQIPKHKNGYVTRHNRFDHDAAPEGPLLQPSQQGFAQTRIPERSDEFSLPPALDFQWRWEASESGN